MRSACVLLSLIGLLACVGCSTLRDTTAPPQTVDRLSRLDYPADAPHQAHGDKDHLDIYLVRSGNDLRLVNRTANSVSGMQLWLNGQYVADSGTILIGTDNVRKLTDFVNRFKEPYPVGTFLNPDQTQPLVLAELYDPATQRRHRLLVRPGNEADILPFEDFNN
ncbi:MAG: hypothetical protein ACE37H_02860 [Phycisphaeraceae bacterium]